VPTTTTTTTKTRPFGSIRQLPSGAFQARYRGPDGQRYTGHTTFDTKRAAHGFLAGVRTDIERSVWRPPVTEAPPVLPTFGAYADEWLAARGLKARTEAHYRALLDQHLLPAFGPMLLTSITPARVRAWHAGFDQGGPARPTLKAHAYSLLKTILGTAQTDDLIATNPCRVRRAGQSSRAKEPKPADVDQLEVLVRAMPEQWRAMVLLASWCCLRFGELTALTRADLDVANGFVHVTKAVVRVPGRGAVLGTPKSDAGVRKVAIPPALVPDLARHLMSHVGPTPDSLLFPAADGGYLSPSTLYGRAPTNGRPGWGWYGARAEAGRPDLRFHDLRHTGAVLAAQSGATMKELQARVGHSTVAAAMRYQHASEDRDLVIAKNLSALIEARAAVQA
jgi:integrase